MDRTDKDYGGLVLARDQVQRFRCVHVTHFHESSHRARIELRQEMERIAAESDENYYQGDEKGPAIDFFCPLVAPAELNRSFISLRDLEVFSPARAIVEPMMRWYEDIDGNFVQQFQTTGFDARIWELYLFAVFTEMGFDISRIHAVPDFRCSNPYGEFCVEATTVNPTQDQDGSPVAPPPTGTEGELNAYLNEYMPVKFGSALTSKLAKKYWERPAANGLPLVFAIQDFSAPQSMVRTRRSFERYITGYDHTGTTDASGELKIAVRKIGSHTWGKTIPSGFFELPDSENVSAVIFSNSGTIAKFNRMGVLAGFGSQRVRLLRVGRAVDPDPNAINPLPFKKWVNDPDYYETWSEGLDVWHNPRAKLPLGDHLLPHAAHHHIQPDGMVISTVPYWQPLSSRTVQLVDPAL